MFVNLYSTFGGTIDRQFFQYFYIERIYDKKRVE